MSNKVVRTHMLDSDGHPHHRRKWLFRVDAFCAFTYVFTPPEVDNNHEGHVAIYGYRQAGHNMEGQVLLFQENGITTDHEAQKLLDRTVKKLGLRIIEL